MEEEEGRKEGERRERDDKERKRGKHQSTGGYQEQLHNPSIHRKHKQ